jgi:hypothetical protein
MSLSSNCATNGQSWNKCNAVSGELLEHITHVAVADHLFLCRLSAVLSLLWSKIHKKFLILLGAAMLHLSLK